MDVWLTGWTAECRKVSLVLLLRDSCGFDLKDAKKCLDDLLGGSSVKLSFGDAAVGRRFVDAATDLGAIVRHGASVHPEFEGGPASYLPDALAEVADEVHRDEEGRLVMTFKIEPEPEPPA
jgi:hypothetical protein